MRFSSVYQMSLQPREPARADGPARAQDHAEPMSARPAAQPAPPDDLDQRVRLVGEWQLGEE